MGYGHGGDNLPKSQAIKDGQNINSMEYLIKSKDYEGIYWI